MVSKRQKLARKKFKEEHPELLPKPEPTPPKDPQKKKKKKSKFKRKKSDDDSKEPVNPNKPKRLSHKKHPLRVPGMKPGESCFICKAQDHIAKNCPEKAQWERNKICLLCRQRGHSLKNCSNKSSKTMERKLCYNCGEYGHSLNECTLPLQDGGTKFANCFICNEQGHLSKDCPKNTHGIYPKGGSCKICGGITHLARDCPNKATRSSGFGNRSYEIEERPRGKVTKLFSGDDLEDDFTFDDTSAEEPKLVALAAAAASDDLKEDINVKSKKKHGPKVVNFVG